MAASKRKRDVLEFLNDSGDLADILLAPDARDLLFNAILHQFAISSLFSNSDHAPHIFIVYAHNNKKEGAAHDACVRTMISWLKKINAQILADQSPLPLHRPRIEGTWAIHNILQNQICLLPAKNGDNKIPQVTSVDKVIVCGSEVLERYCEKPSARSYIEAIVQICVNGAEQSRIKARVEAECVKPGFHHVLTELAFLEFRRFHLSEKYSMVPIMLSQVADAAPMQYLPIFDSTDIKLKLKSSAASDLHKLFFKLLEQLFPADRDFIRPFQQCYESISDRLNLEHEVTREWFNNIVSRGITDTYQTYWAHFCVAVRDGKLQAYTSKLGHDVAALRQMEDVQTTHDILRWLSPISALERHGKFHNKGTSRLAGTCNWIIQDKEFSQWHNCEGSALLVLCGNMGTGKTYCTSRVVDWVQEGLSTNKHSEGFAYVYCNKQDNTLADPCQILRNIIRQLATGPWTRRSAGEIKTVHEKVHELWKASNEEPGIISTFSQWEECLVALINTYPRTTIILDALDECGEVEQEALIELSVKLTSPESKYNPVKIFISTRPEVLHKNHIDRFPAIQIQQTHNKHDIAAFVRTKIAGHSRWSKMTMEFQTVVVDTLLKRSEDMFLFASLQIHQLLRCDTEPDLRECLAELPRSLEEIYEEIYQQATTPGKDRKRLLDRALRWVLCAARPLTTDELLFAISQDFESDILTPSRRDLDEAWMSKLSHNLLSLDYIRDEDDSSHGASVWRLAHQAVADFLKKSDLCENSCANYQAGTLCLMRLLDTFGESSSDDKYDSSDKVQSLQGLQCPCGGWFLPDYLHYIEFEKPLADYATFAWPIHLRALKFEEAHGADTLSKLLQKFLGGAGGTSLAYEKWRQHTNGTSPYRTSQWSFFFNRRPPPTLRDSNNPRAMRRISLASYLGFSFLLKQCLSSSSVELETSYRAGSWTPWQISQYLFPSYQQPLWWSLVALACAHNETEILEHLLDQGAERNTTKEDQVPPIVAAAVGDSREAAEVVLHSGTALCSSFTRCQGHVLSFAIDFESLKVLRLLLDHIRDGSDPLETERGLSQVSINDFKSEDTIRVMLEAEVEVNTPLKDGTMLVAAIHHRWQDLVSQLLEHGADPNMRFENLGTGRTAFYDDAVEASLRHLSGTNRDKLDSLVRLLNGGAHVSTKHVGGACELGKQGHKLVQALLGHDPAPDLNETYTLNGITTSALIEAIKSGSEENTRLLIEHKADVNMKVGGYYGDAISAAFLTNSTWFLKGYGTPYPAVPIIGALIQGGARVDKLTGDRRTIALAAAVHAGLEDAAQKCLELGADPNAVCDHKYTTALGAAAASDHPDMILKLLNNGANVNTYFSTSSTNGLVCNRLALDFPLQAMLKGPSEGETGVECNQCLRIWLRSANILVSKGAIWDINFTQWRRCLEKKAPDFSRQNVKSLDRLLRTLKGNRSRFFKSVPESTDIGHWRIKDTRFQEYWRRCILDLMYRILYEG